MHELSIVLGILDIAAEESHRHGDARIAAIHLRLGALAGVVKDALVSAYEMAIQTCGMEDCRLVIEEIPITVHCTTCNASRPIVSLQEFCCDECRTPSSQILSGRELEVTAMEIVQ